MRLVCNATTPQELREEIVALLIHRATLERSKVNATPSSKQSAQYLYAGTVLENLAGEIKCMEIINAWPSGLTQKVGA